MVNNSVQQSHTGKRQSLHPLHMGISLTGLLGKHQHPTRGLLHPSFVLLISALETNILVLAPLYSLKNVKMIKYHQEFCLYMIYLLMSALEIITEIF